MPSPSAIAVWVRPLPLRMRRMRGPAKIFCSAIGFDNEFTNAQLRAAGIYTIYNFTTDVGKSQDRITLIFQRAIGNSLAALRAAM